MTLLIDQFMWSFQHIFRLHAEYENREVLSHVGLQASREVKVLLIGLASREDLPHEPSVNAQGLKMETVKNGHDGMRKSGNSDFISARNSATG